MLVHAAQRSNDLDEHDAPLRSREPELIDVHLRGLVERVEHGGGYRLRRHLFTDEDGLFQLETIKPGLYPGIMAERGGKLRCTSDPRST